MIIQSIELENFRQYKGNQKIEFSTNEVSPITVILGQNTGGKTTLARAFAWCLYGGTAAELGFKKESSLLNEDVQDLLERGMYDKNQALVKVTLNIITFNQVVNGEIKHGLRTHYRIIRTKAYRVNRKDNSVTSLDVGLQIFRQPYRGMILDPNKNEIEITDKDEKTEIIKSIMPRELSQYFFFWGERLENIIDAKETKKAIQEFAGIDVYDKAEHHTKMAKNYIKKEITAKVSGELESLDDELENINKQIKAKEERLVAREKDIEYFEIKYKEAEEQYYKIQGDIQTQNTIEHMVRKLNIDKDAVKTAQSNFVDNINNEYLCYYIIRDKAKEVIDLVKEDQNNRKNIGWSEITVSAIEEILNNKECICGTKLKDHPEAVAHLKEQFAFAMPNSLGGYLNKVDTTYDMTSNEGPKYVISLLKQYSAIAESLENITRSEKQINVLRNSVGSLDDIKTREENLNKIKNTYNTAQREVGQLSATIADLKERKTKILTRQNTIIKSLKHNALLVARYNILEAAELEFKRMVKDKSKNIRKELQEYATKYFNQMYQGNRIVEINDRFNIQLKTIINGKAKVTETSPGLETVKNFAYIAALISIARDHISSEGKGNEDVVEPYPLVLDAPFSQADEKHILNICKVISSVVEQTILLLMDKDWQIAENELGSLVGKYYRIIKHSETYATIERIN